MLDRCFLGLFFFLKEQRFQGKGESCSSFIFLKTFVMNNKVTIINKINIYATTQKWRYPRKNTPCANYTEPYEKLNSRPSTRASQSTESLLYWTNYFHKRAIYKTDLSWQAISPFKTVGKQMFSPHFWRALLFRPASTSVSQQSRRKITHSHSEDIDKVIKYKKAWLRQSCQSQVTLKKKWCQESSWCHYLLFLHAAFTDSATEVAITIELYRALKEIWETWLQQESVWSV